MFDVSWGETIVIIGISVAAIGRKDLPKASKFIGNKVGKLVGILQGARARADRFAQTNELHALCMPSYFTKYGIIFVQLINCNSFLYVGSFIKRLFPFRARGQVGAEINPISPAKPAYSKGTTCVCSF